MRKLFILLVLLGLVVQAEAGTISRPSKTFGGTSFINGVVPDASDFNGDIDTIYSEFNGSIANANISSAAAIAGSKIDPSFTSNSSITSSAPCSYLDESDQSANARRWYLCVNGGALSFSTYSDAAVLQNTWFSINRSTGQIHLEGTSPLEFEGATANAFETTFQFTDPTADRVITFPDASITVNAASDLTGTSLPAAIVSSSLTSVGTISSGVWNGTAIGAQYGGTGQNTSASTGLPSVSSGTWSIGNLAYTNQALPLSRGYLAGATLSTAGSSATMSIAAGAARDSTNAKNLVLATAIAKTTSAWAVGDTQGGLDTGSIANNTWYHFWLIMRSDTGVVDVLISTSASSPTMPSNYDYKRRIGSGRTNGSAQWILFSQTGDEFLWNVTVEDVDALPNSTSAQTATLTVPTGIKQVALFRATAGSTSGAGRGMVISSFDESDQAPNPNAPPGNSLYSEVINLGVSGEFRVRTNTSAQIRWRLDTAEAGFRFNLETYGWIDRRGRDD